MEQKYFQGSPGGSEMSPRNTKEEHPPPDQVFEARVEVGQEVIDFELERLGWKPEDLLSWPRSDPDQLKLAARLRQETTLPVKWLAARMHLGS